MTYALVQRLRQFDQAGVVFSDVTTTGHGGTVTAKDAFDRRLDVLRGLADPPVIEIAHTSPQVHVIEFAEVWSARSLVTPTIVNFTMRTRLEYRDMP